MRKRGCLHGSLSNRFLFMCQALSVAYARRFYTEVELVTDDYGQELLGWMDFTKIDTSLERIPDYILPEMWSFGKLLAAQIQTEPFIHLDYDVIITKPTRDIFSRERLIVQHVEDFGAHAFYPEVVMQLKKWGYKSDLLYTPIGGAYNCGIIGSNDLLLMKHFAQEGMELAGWMSRHPELFKLLDGFKQALFSCVFEQYVLACIAAKYNITPMQTWTDRNDAVADRFGYVHLWGAKNDPERATEMVEKKLRQEFPEVYEKVRVRLQNMNPANKRLLDCLPKPN